MAATGCPVGFDLDRAAGAGDVVGKAAPRVVFRAGDEASLDRVAMDVTDDFGAGFFAGDVAVEVAGLPELVAGAFELTGGSLLEGLDPLVEQDVRGLVDEEVNVLGHEDVGVDTGVVTGPGLFEEEFGEVLGGWVGEVGETVVTAEGEEVEGLGLVEAS